MPIRMNVSTTDYTCGSYLTPDKEADTGIISSPNYPGNYPNYARCIWLIRAPKKHAIKLTVTDGIHGQESGSNCLDYLEVSQKLHCNHSLLANYAANEFRFAMEAWVVLSYSSGAQQLREQKFPIPVGTCGFLSTATNRRPIKDSRCNGK
jgi:hypothetical protein